MISEYILNKFPKSGKYDLNWMKSHEMGPNSVWLTEFLTDKMKLKPGMKVLDLGCGKACSSIFLAKEFGVKVWATDLWIDATTNLSNIQAMQADNDVFPIYSEAHSLPYADGFFDAIVAVDSYVYFGTDDYYLSYLLKFLKPGGQVGIVSPGFKEEVSPKIISHFGDEWNDELTCFHTVDWWKNHWTKTNLVDIENAEMLPEMWRVWLEWETELEETNMINPAKGSDVSFIKKDNDTYVQFFRMTGRKR
ncbi:MAG: methyltransferase domain-containing protein [Bacteroidales bacterium]|nr:methyltransferase domain-containing protein [Bacteroidales bacterium]